MPKARENPFSNSRHAWAQTGSVPFDWESVKEQVMLDALRAKFTQHDDLKATLLATGDAKLVEHTANDAYWGDGGDGSGKNRLGMLLMRVRKELREEAAATTSERE